MKLEVKVNLKKLKKKKEVVVAVIMEDGAERGSYTCGSNG